KHRRTKIVVTLGPASNDREVIEQLIAAGANVVRLNMSHGTHDEHRERFMRVRAAAEKLAASVAIFADLCGPKIRVGRFVGGRITLTSGDRVVVTTRQVHGGPGLIVSQYAALAGDVEPGSRMLLDDGNLELRAESIEGTEIECRVVTGGVLKDNKGMNLPGVRVSAPALTDKDREDARFALELGVDQLALSFVRSASDVEQLRSFVRSAGYDVPIIAKIEKPEALDHLRAVMQASDAVLVARGDLGVELPAEVVPNVQEQIVDLARVYTRPVIVATQMLESMMTHPHPTRAEVTDVANAVRSGADAVMLSGETAAGQYPLQALQMMDLVARQTEAYLFQQGSFGSFDAYTPTCVGDQRATELSVDDAVAAASARLSRDLKVRALVVLTRSGRSMAVMSAARPAAPVIAVCSDPNALKLGCLLWGVLPTAIADDDHQPAVELARALVARYGLAATGDTVLLVQGFSGDPHQNMPSVTVLGVQD
ncbi:MAG: pyruvate kinase, partial [Polyangiaceae bacterium]|nr:pyruvate kinase [Polyangiaceae bacterium]